MAKTVSFNRKGIEVIIKGIGRPLRFTKQFFASLGSVVDRNTQLNFRFQGARSGGTAWPVFSEKTLKSKTGKFKIRYGTDLMGRPGMQGRKRTKIRRYSNASRLLQASGLFKLSFRVLRFTKKELLFGSRHRLAGKIGSKPERQTVTVTNNDLITFSRMWRRFILAGMKFG